VLRQSYLRSIAHSQGQSEDDLYDFTLQAFCCIMCWSQQRDGEDD